MNYYPANLPLALQASYSHKVAPNILRTSMSDGYARQRVVNIHAPDEVSVSFMFSQTEQKAFSDFVKSVSNGADWFVMPILSCGSLVTSTQAISYRLVRINNGAINYSLSCRKGDGNLWTATATLEVSNSVLDDGTWQAYYTNYEDIGHEDSMQYNTLNLINTTGSISIDTDSYNIANITLNASNTAISINGTVGYRCIVLYLKQGTGSNSITFSNTIRWYNGHTPQLSITANSIDIIQLTSFDGVTWLGLQMGGF